ncbi:MAG: dipeptidase [Gammaproteobacteria bacterium]
MITTRTFALIVATTATLLGACAPKDGRNANATPPPAHALITLDSHDDIPLDFATPGVDPATADLQVNLDKMKSGGLNAGFFIVYVGQTARTEDNYAKAQTDAETKFAAIHRMADELYPNRIEIAYRADDVARIAGAGKLVAAIGIENGFVLGKNLEKLDRYYELGARYVTLAHNGNNDLAGSAQPRVDLGDSVEPTMGVTALGGEAIARMNRLGIMVDISHGSKQTALDAMRLSAAPVIASHSGIAGVSVHARNLDDEALRALRDNGGVVQVVAFDAYLRHQPDEELAALRALRERAGLTAGGAAALPPDRRADYERGLNEIHAQWPPATVKDFVNQIDYAVKLIGIDHVGISSDFGGGGGVVGWNDAAETGNVTAELRARGYNDEDIGKIWSGNLLRVWHAAEDTAARLKTAP